MECKIKSVYFVYIIRKNMNDYAAPTLTAPLLVSCADRDKVYTLSLDVIASLTTYLLYLIYIERID